MLAGRGGLVPQDPDTKFTTGCARSRGSPTATRAVTSHLAAVVGSIIGGATLHDTLDTADEILGTWEGGRGRPAPLRLVERSAATGCRSPHEIECLGGGWTGHEALAIAVACVESEPTFEAGVLAAVNHSGDSDSTGSIVGNILGALYGVDAVPTRWLAELELRDEIEQLARDLVYEFHDRPDPVTDDSVGPLPGS